MSRFHTFLLTIFLDEQESDTLRGRIRSIATDREAIFARLEELLEFVRAEARKSELPIKESEHREGK